MVLDPTIRGALSRLGFDRPRANTLIVHTALTADVSREKIWAVLSDLEQWPRWGRPWIESARWLESRTFEVGARFEFIRRMGFPIGRQVTLETVREVIQGTSMSWWRGEGGIVSCRTWHLEAQSDGSTLVISTEVFVGPLVLLAKPVIGILWNRKNQRLTERLIDFCKRGV